MSEDNVFETTDFHWYVQTLVWEQEQKIESTKPMKKQTKKDTGYASWYPEALKRVKEEILPKLQPTTKEDYKIIIYELKQETYEYAERTENGWKAGKQWSASLKVIDNKNLWRGPITQHGARFTDKERTIRALNDWAEKIINYDLQHNKELLEFKAGKTALCGVCKTPFTVNCDNHFHECETARQGGYKFQEAKN